jgi:hypothetical protein
LIAMEWMLLLGLAAAQEPVDFARDLAPLIERRCLPCHQPAIRKGDLSLSTPADLLANDLLSPGKPQKSALLRALSPGAGGKRPKMPKDADPLDAAQLDLFRRWISEGARWPEQLVLRERSKADKSWWSLRPLSPADAPTPEGLPEAWAKNPVDRFVFARLAEKGLRPSGPAGRRELLRRVTYDLTGLPPTPAEMDAFIADPSPEAYEKVVDRLLASFSYGEQWGRHWLDVVRFGESTGFERNIILDNAWPFRDYVIRSFNEDKPFDRLVLEHLAGDVIGGLDPAVEVGTGFLVAGPYDNVGNSDVIQQARIRADTLDDVIRATGEAFLGVTVGCARCHNHKFDPILQLDYYRLYATFADVRHGNRTVAGPEARREQAKKEAGLQDRLKALAAERGAIETAALARAEPKAAAIEAGWTRPPADRFLTEETFEPVEALHLRLVALRCDDAPEERAGWSIDEFEAWTADLEPRNAARSAKAEGAAKAIDGLMGTRWTAPGPLLSLAFDKPTTLRRIVFSNDRLRDASRKAERFLGEYLIEISTDGKSWRPVADSRDRKPANAALRRSRLIDAELSPEERARLLSQDQERERLLKERAAIPPLPSWWVGDFKKPDGPVHVFVGGDPQKKGEPAEPENPSFLSDVVRPYKVDPNAAAGERRLALARWIVARDNPLTPRVLANRIWHYHFGTGLVDTPGDFGYMGGRPTHPELLDWLARRLIDGGWRFKSMNRLIVTSQAYRQSAAAREDAARIDGDSRLRWRYPPRRLSGEELRDTMLALSGKLAPPRGGPGFRLYRYVQDNVATYVPLDRHGPETYRRAVYHQNARASRVDVLTDFDCPDSAFSAPRRSLTTTPMQALTLLNHSFTADMSGFLAERLVREGGPEAGAQVDRAFALAYGRPPSPDERAQSAAFIGKQGLKAFARVILNTNELIYLH